MLRPKTTAYKLLVVLIWSEHQSIQRSPDGLITIRTSGLATHTRQQNFYVRKQLRYLGDLGFLSDLNVGYGTATFRINLPSRLTERAT